MALFAGLPDPGASEFSFEAISWQETPTLKSEMLHLKPASRFGH